MIYLVAIILALITIGIYGIYVYFDERKRKWLNQSGEYFESEE